MLADPPHSRTPAVPSWQALGRVPEPSRHGQRLATPHGRYRERRTALTTHVRPPALVLVEGR